MFSILQGVKLILEPHGNFSKRSLGAVFPAVKGPGLKADHSPPSVVEFKNMSRYATCLQGTMFN